MKDDYCLKYLLVSIQDALDMNISPSLRAVTVAIEDVIVDVVFYYDGEINDDELDMVSTTEAELLASYECFCNIKRIDRIKINNAKHCEEFYYIRRFTGERYDFPRNINNKKLDYWIYMRKEYLKFDNFGYNFKYYNQSSFLEVRLLVAESLLGLMIPSIRFINLEYDINNSLLIRIIHDGEINKSIYSIKSELKKRIFKELLNIDIHIHIIRYDFPKFIFELEYKNSVSDNFSAIYARAKECIGCWD